MRLPPFVIARTAGSLRQSSPINRMFVGKVPRPRHVLHDDLAPDVPTDICDISNGWSSSSSLTIKHDSASPDVEKASSELLSHQTSCAATKCGAKVSLVPVRASITDTHDTSSSQLDIAMYVASGDSRTSERPPG